MGLMCYIRRMVRLAALAVLLLPSFPVAQDSRPLPTRRQVRSRARASSWGKKLVRIPSTVIDTGVLRNIPYMSFEAGDYELNIYGDPYAPCCIEVGIYEKLLKSDAAKKNCLDLIRSLFPHALDRKLIASLNLKKDIKVRRVLPCV